jgi:hypothetical protein
MRVEAVVLIAALLALSDRSQAQVIETKKGLTLEGAKAAAAAATAASDRYLGWLGSSGLCRPIDCCAPYRCNLVVLLGRSFIVT